MMNLARLRTWRAVEVDVDLKVVELLLRPDAAAGTSLSLSSPAAAVAADLIIIIIVVGSFVQYQSLSPYYIASLMSTCYQKA